MLTGQAEKAPEKHSAPGEVTLMVECLPSKCEALSSKPQDSQKRNKKKGSLRKMYTIKKIIQPGWQSGSSGKSAYLANIRP
jgi:hypothetical protein